MELFVALLNELHRPAVGQTPYRRADDWTEKVTQSYTRMTQVKQGLGHAMRMTYLRSLESHRRIRT